VQYILQNSLALKYIKSHRVDPYYNLALEEYLLNNVGENEVILYLWQNKDTIVIGKNQNPWKECKVHDLEEAGGNIARRLSGGGAVFHDLGNLNFTFLMKEELYNLEKQLQVILQGIRSIGIDAEFTGRNDITVQGRKFSGNAFYFDNDKAYHHGTILINSDMNKLTKYLQVSKEKIASKGIDSVRSRVVNLSEIKRNITLEETEKALEKSFCEVYGGELELLNVSLENEEFKKLIEKYSSWQWRFGESPQFDVSFAKRFSFGGIEIGFTLKNGEIDEVTIYSDFMNTNLIDKIKTSFKGIKFNISEVIHSLDHISKDDEERTIIDEIQRWLLEKEKNF
jgi:lipoate-protein ligase A